MKRDRLSADLAGGVVLLQMAMCGLMSSAVLAQWSEGPTDAGEILSQAQRVHETGGAPLDTIEGSLDADDADLYRIHICEPMAFSATTVGGSTVDTRLYLFALSGVGRAMSDDSMGTQQSTLGSAFIMELAPGDYYLAVSVKGRDPLDLAGDALWNDEPAGVERAPDGPGASNGVWSWGGGGAGGSYTITLSGAHLDACSVSDARAFGIDHEAMGSAALRAIPASDDPTGVHLIVDGIGSSGLDGVRMHLGESDGSLPGYFADPLLMEEGATVHESQFGVVNGVPDSLVCSFSGALIGGRIVGGANFDQIFAQRYRVDAFLDGVLVLSDDDVEDNGVSYAATARCKKRTSPDDCSYPANKARFANVVSFDDPTPVSLDGAPDVLADALCFCPADESEPVEFGPISEQVLLVTGIPFLEISDGGISAIGIPNVTGLGNTGLNAKGGVLAMIDIGSSGCDGVEIDLGSVSSFALDLTVDGTDPAPTNSFLHARTLGSFQGTPDSSLGEIHFAKGAAGDVAITVDFSALGSPTHRVQVFDNGVLLADFPGHTGPVGSASRWPNQIEKLGGQTECYAGGFVGGTIFQIDGQVFVGDELRVLAESGSSDSKSAIVLTGAGISGFTIESARLGDGCPADLDGDGDADSSDFFRYLDLFVSGSPDADLDGDGDRDADDFFQYLDFFAQGC